MSEVTGVGSGNNTQTTGGSKGSSVQNLDMDHFLKLMIAELQNQDPLNPLENHQLLEQIGQIREVGATDSLTKTLDAVLLGQNVSSASNLIGKEVRALNDKGSNVEGTVERVTIIDGAPTLHIGQEQVKLSNVSEIRAASN